MCAADLLPSNFSHLYVEEDALGYPMADEVLKHFPGSIVVRIRHYKDVFNRPGQDSAVQSRSKNLILAVNRGRKIFDASPVCQDFGYGKFYYVQSAMNCVFNCDYCFLKGMYGTSNIVIFVNTDEYIKECEDKLKEGPMYLCASYDTDITALSSICSWQRVWEQMALKNENLTIELRTKSVVNNAVPCNNLIYAFTLSPGLIIKEYEKNTPSLDKRIESVNKAIDSGAKVRLCFDPLIYIRDYEVCYNDFADTIIRNIDIQKVKDISIGTFRISSDYLLNLRKGSPDSPAVLFPFDRENGFCVYPKDLKDRMICVLKDRFEGAGFGSKLYIF